MDESCTIQAQPLGCIKKRDGRNRLAKSLTLRGHLIILHQFGGLHKLWDSPDIYQCSGFLKLCVLFVAFVV